MWLATSLGCLAPQWTLGWLRPWKDLLEVTESQRFSQL